MTKISKRKVAVWESPGNITVCEQLIPTLKPGEVLVKVQSCAICGSDLRVLKHGNARVKPGQIVGHEISGVICEISSDVKNWQIGDRVSLGADVPCGECVHCIAGNPNCCDINYAIGHQFEGGFSEYLIVNKLTLELGPVARLKVNTDFDSASLAEPLACCLNGFERGMMSEGRSVVVFGAGPIGMMLGMLAVSVFKSKFVLLIDPNQGRLDKALEVGAATCVLNPLTTNVVQEVMKMTLGNGADMIFTACPIVETHEQAVLIVAKRGVINLFGGLPATSRSIELNSNYLHYREACITGSHGATPAQHAKAVEMIEGGVLQIDKLITHRFELSDINKAYSVAERGDSIKVIIKPNLIK